MPIAKKIVDQPLGPLELEIMKVLWQSDEWLDVQAVVDRLTAERAYTTVMTTLVRLARKRLVKQKKSGRAYVYRPSVTQNSIVKAALARLANSLFNGDVAQLMPQLLDLKSDLEPGQLRRAQALADKIKDLDKLDKKE